MAVAPQHQFVLIGVMGLLCLLGHDDTPGVYNAGLFFGACRRCRRTIIRGPGGRWYQLPRGARVRWGGNGTHVAPSHAILARARQEAPMLHRLRRPRHALERYYT